MKGKKSQDYNLRLYSCPRDESQIAGEQATHFSVWLK